MISEKHRQELERGSAISPEIVAERGYRTVVPAALPETFNDYQRRAGLLIPIRDVTGDIAAWQLKADDPRLGKSGKPLKYDSAAGGCQCVDVPVRSRPHLDNPAIPLWITEGAKKVDAGLSHSIRCIVGLQGVYGWRGTNEHGGKVVIPDFESIALNGREVILAFDSDVMTKPSVRSALDRLGAFLKQRGAKVRYLLMPDLPDDEKCGLDDWFVSGGSLQRLQDHIVDELPDRPGSRDAIRPAYRRMSEVESRQLEWLWPGYIVQRKVNLIAGYGGVGKGQLACNLIARLSRGDVMPNSESRAFARILILAAEDDPNEDLRPRLDANRANHDNIFILDGISASDGTVSWVDVQKHAAVIEEVIRAEGIDLLYIDPVSSYMPGTDRNSQGNVRDALGNVQRIINDTGVTVLATVHLGKASERRGAQRILGSVEFVNLARNVLAINDLPDEHQPDDVLRDENIGRRKVIQAVKCNSGILGPPLSFSRPLNAAVAWHGIAPVGFDDSFTVTSPKDQTKQDAKAWLFGFLSDGMKPQSAVEHAAKDADISKATLRRAKDELGIESKKIGFPGVWHWHLSPSTTLGQHYQKDSIEDAHMPVEGDRRNEVSTVEDTHLQNMSTFVQSPEDAHVPDQLSPFAPDPEGAHIVPYKVPEHLHTIEGEVKGDSPREMTRPEGFSGPEVAI